MNVSDEMGRREVKLQGLILLIVLALVAAPAGGANRATSPDRNASVVRPSAPLTRQQQPTFGPARPLRPSPAGFTPEMPLGQAIDILRNAVQPPLNIVVLWRDLEANADIDRNTPIGIDGLHGLRLRQYLEVLLTSLSATAPTRITYIVDHGVVTVGTIDSLPKPKQVTRVYDISDLVAPPSLGGMGMGMGMGMMPGMMQGMMPGLGGMPYGGAGGYAPGSGNYGAQGYNSLGGLGGFLGGTQGAGVYAR